MGSRNLTNSVSFAKGNGAVKARLTKIKIKVIGFLESVAGKPLTAASKKKAAMSVTRKSTFIREVVHRDVLSAVIEMQAQELQVSEMQAVSEIQESIETPVIEVPVAESVSAEYSDDSRFEDYTCMEVYRVSAMAATSTEAVSPVSSSIGITDLDEEDFSDTSVSEQIQTVEIEETPEEKAFFENLYEEIEIKILQELLPELEPALFAGEQEETEEQIQTVEIEETPEEKAFFEELYELLALNELNNEILPVLAPEILKYDYHRVDMFGNRIYTEAPAKKEEETEYVPAVENAEEKAFLEKLYGDLEAYILFNDVIPSILAEERSVPDYVISDILSNEVSETVIEVPDNTPDYVITDILSNEASETVIECEEEQKPISEFINGSVRFSFGFPVSAARAGPTGFSFIMGVQDSAEEDECDEEIRGTVSGEPVMAASQTTTRVYL